MANYSFNHDSFGKTTNAAGAAGGNVRYNADLSKTQMDEFLKTNADYLAEHGFHRPKWQIDAHLIQIRHGRSAAENAAYNARGEATYAVRSHIIPPEPDQAAAWFDQQEKIDRKNARMSDRFIGALPRELTPEQCLEAVEAFCRQVTHDRIPWHFALHLELDQKNEPDWNPHTHIVFRDRDIETGKRYLHTTAGAKERAELEKKGVHPWSTKDFRVAWEQHMNHALERAGHEVRIDHRSLKEQGIDRKPQIHLGPKVRKMAEKGKPFKSRDKQQGKRLMLYSFLDNGSRADYNARIREENARRNERKAAHEITGHCPSDPRTAEAFAAMTAGQRPQTPNDHEMQRLRDQQAEQRRAMYEEQKRDRDALRAAQDSDRQLHRAWAKQFYAKERQKAFEQTKEQTAETWKQVRTIKNRQQNREAAAALKLEQKQLYVKISAGRIEEARVEKDRKWQAMRQTQLKERKDLRASHREEYKAMTRQHAVERFALAQQQRAQRVQEVANRFAAGAYRNQSMDRQQQAALDAIQLKRALQQQAKVPAPQRKAPQAPVEAARKAQERVREIQEVANRLAARVHQQKGADGQQQAPRQVTPQSVENPAKVANQIREIQEVANHLAARVYQQKGADGQQQAPRQVTPQSVENPAKVANQNQLLPQDPAQAARVLAQIAFAEKVHQTKIRTRLLAQRQTHQLLGAGAERMRDRAGKAIPAFEDSPQNRSQQAALSGRPLTESERTNASPELREVLARQDARTAQRSLFMTAATNREQGKGRSGGRGGR